MHKSCSAICAKPKWNVYTNTQSIKKQRTKKRNKKKRMNPNAEYECDHIHVNRFRKKKNSTFRSLDRKLASVVASTFLGWNGKSHTFKRTQRTTENQIKIYLKHCLTESLSLLWSSLAFFSSFFLAAEVPHLSRFGYFNKAKLWLVSITHAFDRIRWLRFSCCAIKFPIRWEIGQVTLENCDAIRIRSSED